MNKSKVSKMLLAGLLAAPLWALAHGPMQDGGATGRHGGMSAGGHPASFDMSGDRHGGGMGMLHGLDLSKEQRDQIFALMHSQMPVQREKAQALHQAMTDLRQLSQAERFDADKARALSETVGKLQAERALMRTEMGAKMRALLTPEQRKQLDERMSRRSESRHEHPMGGRHRS